MHMYTHRWVRSTHTHTYLLHYINPLSPMQVCCQCSDLLGRLFSRPLLRVQEANPLLYTYVQDLVTVEVRGHHCTVYMSGMMEILPHIPQALRQNILHMKQYFVQCKAALEAHLLQKVLISYPSSLSTPYLLSSTPSSPSWIHFPISRRNLACFLCWNWKPSTLAGCYLNCKRFMRSLHNTFAGTAL